MSTQYPSHPMPRGEVYGPRATPEAAARVGAIVEHVGAQAELLAAMLREDDAAVLMGHRDDLAPLLVDGPPALDGSHRAHPYRIRPAMRAKLAALRERLLRLLASHAASLTETAGRCDAMASRCRNRAHDLAALVASTRRAVADAASAGEGGPCPS